MQNYVQITKKFLAKRSEFAESIFIWKFSCYRQWLATVLGHFVDSGQINASLSKIRKILHGVT